MVSPRKSASCLGLIPEEGKMNVTATKSCESLYSNSSKGSANIIYKRKQQHGMGNKFGGKGGGATRQPTIIPATNDVRQRVLSARRLRVKTFQNQLADAQQTIAELAHENRILRTLHKRQDSALSKYESNNAELPQLLHSHAEELRVWQTKYRNLQAVNKELEHKLKQKEAIILSLGDQNKYYIQLNKDKNLEDRQRLTEKLQMLETRLQEKDNDIKMMARKLQLESKQCKQQLQLEQKKTKEVLMKLENARLELSGFRKLEEIQFQEKFNMTIRRNKGGTNDNFKDERDIDKCSLNTATTIDIENNAGDIVETPNSQRSTHSTHNLTERTSRTIKRVNISNTPSKNMSNLSSTMVGGLKQINKQTPANSNKTLGNLGRIDQGDGDASNVQEVFKATNFMQTKNQQRQHSTLSSITQTPQPERIQNNYEDDYENDEDGTLEVTPDSEDETNENLHKKLDLNGGFINNIDGVINNVEINDDNEEEEEEDDNEVYYEETQQIEISNTGKKTRMKEEISSIRKQISNDYKEREAFLDTFCRQATNGVLKEETQKKRNSIATERSVPSSRKHKLLAALKAIDDNKSQD